MPDVLPECDAVASFHGAPDGDAQDAGMRPNEMSG
jgi:hypothetical protein